MAKGNFGRSFLVVNKVSGAETHQKRFDGTPCCFETQRMRLMSDLVVESGAERLRRYRQSGSSARCMGEKWQDAAAVQSSERVWSACIIA